MVPIDPSQPILISSLRCRGDAVPKRVRERGMKSSEKFVVRRSKMF
jgi:hypothetical protein